MRQANIEAGAGKTQLEKQRQMMDALEAQLAEKEAALAHITSTAAGNISESLSPDSSCGVVVYVAVPCGRLALSAMMLYISTSLDIIIYSVRTGS